MITSLRLQDFRNYKDRTFSFKEKNIVFCGENGKGKTNVLEAIAILSVGKSWRETGGIDLIRDTTDSALIQAETINNNLYKISIQERSRVYEKNGKKIPLTRYFGDIPTLLFVPEYLQLFSGTRSNRVRFFDRFCLQTSEDFRSILSDFNRAIRQKNALLKQSDNLSFSEMQLQIRPWNILLEESIPRIFEIRKSLLEEIQPILQSELETISQKKESIKVELLRKESYIPTKEGVHAFYKTEGVREIQARRCLIGAHLDDFHFVLREKPLIQSASRGEERSVLLSLLTAQKEILKKTRGITPILLLDDVFSELDQSRQDYLEQLCDESQIFFTTTHKSHFQNFQHIHQIYEIE